MMSDVPRAVGAGGERAWRLAMAGVYVVLIVLGVRCTVSVDPFPGWSGDPLEMESPITGITPAWSLVLDVVTGLAGAAVLWGCAARGLYARWWEVLLVACGAVAVAVHAYAPGRGTVENLSLGSCWLAAMVAGLACWQAGKSARARRVIVAAMAGLAVMLVLRAAYQVQVEHPLVYRNFLANKAQIIAAQGWSEGSPMALAYERRISQAEGSAWFGLANVFATVMAVGLTLGVGLLVGVVRAGREKGVLARGVVVALGVLAVGCGYGVVMAGSKGGFAAAGLGLGLVVVLSWLKGRMGARALGMVAVGVPLLALGAVVVRGLVGDRMGELSILFRWFYLQGAARVIGEHPVLGVGPAGFKDAYILMKPRLSPEEVSSPHSVYFDFVATLGLGGLAWCVVIWRQLWSAGASVESAGGDVEAGATVRDEVRALLVVFGVVTAVGAVFEHRIAMVDTTVLRVVMLVAATCVAGGVLSAMRRGHGAGVNVVLAAAVLAGWTHAQIELTGVTAGAGMYLLVLLGVAAAGAGGGGGRMRWLGAVVAAGAAGVAGVGLPAVAAWEGHLRRAAAMVEPVPYVSSRMAALAGGKGLEGDSREALAKDLSAELGRTVAATDQRIAEGVHGLRLERAEAARRELVMASGLAADFQTARAAQRLSLQLASAVEGERRRALLDEGERVMMEYIRRSRASAPVWAWVGLSLRTRAMLVGDEGAAREAVEAYEKAAELAPGEPLYRLELARLAAGLGDRAGAARWAGEALRLNEYLRLDPVRQFGERELGELAGLSVGGTRPVP